ncbi:uncharacterized protein [Typha latifolia]|uniref:uncharacterized protein isoform X2 n=1 Tax=Typha latifolia TaxID=4733 RepID=UPI003C305D40
MSGGRGHRRKMVGRVADGGCGTEEPSCPVSSSPAPAPAPVEGAVDVFVQARKALSLRSPFDTEEDTARVPTLPAGLASFLARQTDGRKKHKKNLGESGEKPPSHAPVASTVWDQTEEFFRPVTLGDIDLLVPELLVSAGQMDSCFLIPVLGSVTEEEKKEGIVDAAAVEVTSNSTQENLELVKEEQSAELTKAELVEEEEKPMEVDEVGTSGSGLPEKEEEEDLSFNWVLGAKERFVLTSERPNKKRKLLGGDAGLEHLLVLPNLQSEAGSTCDFCCLGDSGTKSNRLLCCDSCKVLVHQKCYGVHEMPDGLWLCSRCEKLQSTGRSLKKSCGDPSMGRCVLCPKEGGALKPVERDSGRNADSNTLKFAHLFCSLWIPEVYVEDTKTMEPIMNVAGVQETRKKLVCNVCKVKHGACVRCSHGTCRASFHPICARESKHQMEIWGKFGNDNVELRAFCSKHSTIQDISNAKKNFNKKTVGDDSLAGRPSHAILATRKIPKLRFTRKNRDKSMAHELTTSSSDNMVKTETNVEKDLVASRLKRAGTQAVQSKEMDTAGAAEGGNLTQNSADVAVVLRKLIDRGKVSVGDIASEIGISSDSLEAALVGETTTFSPGLKLKIIKWLQNSVHMPAVQHLKDISSSAVVSDNNFDRAAGPKAPNDDNVKSPYVLSDDKVTAIDIPDPVLVKSLPPRRRTKGSIQILKDNKTLCASGVAHFQQNGNNKIVDETGDIAFLLTEDMKGEANGKISSISNQECIKEEEFQEMTVGDSLNSTDASPPLELLSGDKGNPVKRENSFEAEQKAQPTEGFSSLDSGANQANEANGRANALANGYLGHLDLFGDQILSDKHILNFGGSCSISSIHPFIRKRLMQVCGHMKQETLEAQFSEVAKSAGPSCSRRHFHSSYADMNERSDVVGMDQVSKANSLGILELSVEDEVEGELVYLQNRLLNSAVAIKHCCEGLMFKVVQNLPEELDVSIRRKWDLILVTQFLREIREAKKRGRKERRHKEAQAVLAAATAAAASSSRNSALRKDANDEIVPSNQESPLKFSGVTGRVRQPSPAMPRTKDSSRLALNKVSSDKHSGFLQMPDFVKENALYCDICMRVETVLNRIFVCFNCKVAVHLDCYRSLKNFIGPWRCEVCEQMPLQATSTSNQADSRDRFLFAAECSLCGGASGAFRKTKDAQWVHAFCAEWLLESKFKRGQENLVEGMDNIPKEKDFCCICQRNVGACLKCSNGDCQIMFHPSCARGAGFYMNTKGVGGRLQHKAYCRKHSSVQREADSQQYEAEELKSMKDIRVELEKLRLLCERIIKREKLKRDLVLCSHEILASKRDYNAFSELLRSPFYPPGVSSESATTSINNKSYSGMIQRSDDVTVDSTISGKRTLRVSLHNRDVDRHTDDSSTSQLSFKRKLADRASFAGKQLPQRPPSVGFRNSGEDGEKKSKSRKPTETFQKEVVMTSDQASRQNQRLPKGFAYVPKEKPLAGDSESCEPQEPGG